MFFFPFDPYTPYIKGRELAINENRDDIQEDDRDIAAQLQNIFAMNTFAPRVNNAWTTAERNYLSAVSDARASDLEGYLHPGNLARARAQSQFWVNNADPYTQSMYAAQMAGMGYDTALAQAGQRMLPLQEEGYAASNNVDPITGALTPNQQAPSQEQVPSPQVQDPRGSFSPSTVPKILPRNPQDGTLQDSIDPSMGAMVPAVPATGPLPVPRAATRPPINYGWSLVPGVITPGTGVADSVPYIPLTTGAARRGGR